MLEWMRRYNAARGDRPPLSFSGFDAQLAPAAMKRVSDLFARAGGADHAAIAQLYADWVQPWPDLSKLSPQELERLKESFAKQRENAAKALDLLVSRREALVQASTPTEYADAQQAARVVLQSADLQVAYAKGGEIPANEVRDQAMADNVRWLLEERFPGQKIVLWAHDGHVGAAPYFGFKTLGMHLRERYGKQMVILGFSSDVGEIRAFAGRRTLKLYRLAPAKPLTIDGLFAETNQANLILDLRRLPEQSALSKWLASPRLQRSIGSWYDRKHPSRHYHETDLPRAYDGLIFIRQVTATVPTQKYKEQHPN